VSWYDSRDGSVKYRYNRRNAPGTINNNSASYAWTNLDGGYDQYDQTALTATGPYTAVAANGRIVGYGSRPPAGTRNDVGQYNDIAVTSQGYPVIVYFDKTNKKLRIAVSNRVDPFAASGWNIRDLIADTDRSVSGAEPAKFDTGHYVSIQIDTRAGVNQNRAHIAAFNLTNGQLVYISGIVNPNAAWLTSGDQENNNIFTLDTVQVVDNVGNVGKWSKLSLDEDGKPWIAYMDLSNRGSKDGVKIAFLDRGAFTKDLDDVYGTSLNGWETMHVPARYNVDDKRIGLENYPTRNYTRTAVTAARFWKAAVSYLVPSEAYRIAYYVDSK
jgi:hypothetical protein